MKNERIEGVSFVSNLVVKCFYFTQNNVNKTTSTFFSKSKSTLPLQKNNVCLCEYLCV